MLNLSLIRNVDLLVRLDIPTGSLEFGKLEQGEQEVFIDLHSKGLKQDRGVFDKYHAVC